MNGFVFLGKLGIDLKLLFAQVLNFLVLLWLLKILLYKPLIKILEERSKKAKAIEEAKKEIQRKREEIGKKGEEIIRETKEKAKQIIEESREISKKEKEKILARAEAEIQQILKRAKERAQFEIERAKERERNEILEKTKNILQEVLSKSLSRELHRKYLNEMIEELRKLDFKKIKEKEVISVTVVSAYPLNRKEEKQISRFLFKRLRNPAFQEKVDSNLIAGVKIIIDEFLIDGTLKGKIEKAIY